MGTLPKSLFVRADLAEDGKIEWGLSETNPPTRGVRETVTFDYGDSFDVSIQLVKDNTGYGLEFDHSDPLWAQNGGGCPPQKGIRTNEIPPGQVGFPPKGGGGKDYKMLEFRNKNKVKGNVIYQLNFVKRDGTAADPQLDPEFKNGGGGTGVRPAAALLVVAGAVLGASVALVSSQNLTAVKVAEYAAAGAIVGLALHFLLRGQRERLA